MSYGFFVLAKGVFDVATQSMIKIPVYNEYDHDLQYIEIEQFYLRII